MAGNADVIPFPGPPASTEESKLSESEQLETYRELLAKLSPGVIFHLSWQPEDGVCVQSMENGTVAYRPVDIVIEKIRKKYKQLH